ncbi:response regulator transcription factor [Treponema sp.]|uniref:response regulator transcription factor n=1 Tax=Treponema sp. TaxID=166 RepID=UPI003890A2B4
MRVALVDDEKNVRLAVGTALKKEGFEVLEFSNGQLAYDDLISMEGTVPDIYVLDIMMPVMDGIMFLQKFKAIHPEIPAIFLTSRDEEFDKVLGLELGADDYLCKPFSVKELIARIKVLVRRYDFLKVNATQMEDKGLKDRIASNEITVDSDSYTAFIGDRPLVLTVTEFRLIELFVNRKGAVLTREQLINAAFPEDNFVNDRAIDCHIKRLRKKIGSEKIETVYGLGYRFTE